MLATESPVHKPFSGLKEQADGDPRQNQRRGQDEGEDIPRGLAGQ